MPKIHNTQHNKFDDLQINNSLKIVFAGTPNFSIPTLQKLIESPHQICAVYTQPDRPAGRGRKMFKSPIKQLAEIHNIDVQQPQTLRTDETQKILRQYQPDLMVVVAYGLLLPQDVLNIPKYGCINVHASLLPRWRGAAPIQRAILAGDTQTGITIMQMEAGLDTGPMLNKKTCPIESNDTSQTLHDKLATLGAEQLIKTLDAILKNEIIPTLQNEAEACYAKKIIKKEANIDWHEKSTEIERMIRAFNPWPIAFSYLNKQSVRIWDAEVVSQLSQQEPGTIVKLNADGIFIATGQELIKIKKLQFPGGRAMGVSETLNARRDLFQVGTCFNIDNNSVH